MTPLLRHSHVVGFGAGSCADCWSEIAALSASPFAPLTAASAAPIFAAEIAA